ncbi:MAG: glycine/betaine ABC transporter substrate-binding protein, partial [Fusobacteriaceae bacterium]|nr:glycine/betaine ABC transporter substrate-binding protein [Fusobacteriaceae bacterium]
MKKLILLFIALSTIFVACGKKEKKIIIGHKNFTEQRILGQMVSILIEKKTDYKTEVKELGGTMIVNQALLSGDIDISLEYTGTGYIYLLKQSELKDSKKVYEYVKKEFEKQGITWLNPLGFNNTYAFAVKEETAKKYKLEKMSDLKGIAEKLSIGELADFFEREDGMVGITKTYGFKF